MYKRPFWNFQPEPLINSEQKPIVSTSASLEQNGLLSAADFEKLHPDSEQLLKVCFEELRSKLIKNQKKYGWSNEWLTQNWEDECREQMMKHIEKGDPRDVAIYAMFMIYRGWSTADFIK